MSGLNIHVILKVVGVAGLLLSLMFWSRRGGVRRGTTYVDEGPPPGYQGRGGSGTAAERPPFPLPEPESW